MKIVHITYGFSLGGIETMLTNIANEQVKHDNDLYIVVINDLVDDYLAKLLDKRIHLICIKRKIGSKSLVPYLRLNILLCKLKSDVIHLHYSSIGRFIFLSKLKRRLCVTQHDMCNDDNSKYLYKSRKIFAISNVVRQDIMNYVNLDSEVILNGIRPELINHIKSNRSDVFRIVQISRLVYKKKGQDILIKAVKQLVRKGYDNFHVDFIGSGDDYSYLRELVEKYEIESFVSFLGSKEQTYIFEHLCDYDLLVQPSIFEGFGLTVTEAMAAKVPVLVSKNQGPLEIIEDGRYGFYFENRNVEDCASKIELFLLKLNEKEMIESAYKRVTSLYDVKVTAGSYLKKYRELCSY